MPLLLDTHTWVWAATKSARLSVVACEAIGQSDKIYVSPISFYEIGQKERIGKWPGFAGQVDGLAQLLEDMGGFIAPLGADICLRASQLDWVNRDPFDRILAATAEVTGMALVSADTAFDRLGSRVLRRIW